MAKGGSLLGRADSTLAAMSYKEAMADVTPDLGKVYKEEALNQALFQAGVENYFNTLHADYNALGDELKEATTTMMADLSAGITPDEAGMEMFSNELNRLKEKLKNTPKGKKGDLARAKIRAELGRLKNSTQGMDQTLTTLGTMIENDQFDVLATGQDLPLLKAIAKGEATKKIVNGNLVYSIPNPAGGDDITMNQQELREAVVLKDPKFQSNFNKIHAGFNALGKQKGTTWENKRQGAVNAYEDIFTTKHSFATTINNKQGNMEYSFVEALIGKGDNDIIYKTLMEMGNKDNFFNGFDADKDGDVDAQDFAHAENGQALINSLTNIKDKVNFNFQVAKKVAAEYYADGLAKNEFEDGTKLRPATSIPKYLIPGTAEWERVQNLTGPPKTRNVEFQLFLGEDEDGERRFEKNTTTSDELINLDNQLGNLMNQSSFDTESYVNVFGKKIGYFPGRGFAPIKIREDGQLVRPQIKATEGPYKWTVEGGFWKTPQDVFQNFSIPTTYSKQRFYEGQKAKHKDGRPIIFKGGKWIYND